MKKLQTAARSAAARSIMASAGALSLVAASLTSVPAAFAAPNASAAAEVNPNASYEELTYAPAPDASLVERSNPAMVRASANAWAPPTREPAPPPPLLPQL